MPVKAMKKDGKWRVVEAATGKIAKNRSGTPIDGGGHSSKMTARNQAIAVNMNMRKRGRI